MKDDFVYESCSPTPVLGTKMSGWFEFKYLEGPQKGQRFKAMIDPFELNIEEGTQLIRDPKFEDWMRE